MQILFKSAIIYKKFSSVHKVFKDFNPSDKTQEEKVVELIELAFGVDTKRNAKYLLYRATIEKTRYDKFKTEMENAKLNIITELNGQKINASAENVLEGRSKNVLQEYSNQFMEHVEELDVQYMKDIIQNCKSSPTKINAMTYLTFQFKNVHVPKCTTVMQYWANKQITKIILRFKHIVDVNKDQYRIFQEQYDERIKQINCLKQPKKGEKHWLEKIFGSNPAQNVEHLSSLSERQWNEYKNDLKLRAKHTKTDNISQNREKAVKKFVKGYEHYLDKYEKYVYSNYLNIDIIKKNQISDVVDTYKTLQIQEENTLYKEFIEFQKTKMESKTGKPVATFQRLLHREKAEFIDEKYDLFYTVPQKIPPTFEMKFVSIDLKSLEDDDEIKVNVMKNMKYEMRQTDKLLLAHIMANGDAVMAIRTDNEEKMSETKVIASYSRQLTESESLITFKKKKVMKIAFCESKHLFVVLFRDELAFFALQDG
eukprot:329929_1